MSNVHTITQSNSEQSPPPPPPLVLTLRQSTPPPPEEKDEDVANFELIPCNTVDTEPYCNNKEGCIWDPTGEKPYCKEIVTMQQQQTDIIENITSLAESNISDILTSLTSVDFSEYDSDSVPELVPTDSDVNLAESLANAEQKLLAEGSESEDDEMNFMSSFLSTTGLSTGILTAFREAISNAGIVIGARATASRQMINNLFGQLSELNINFQELRDRLPDSDRLIELFNTLRGSIVSLISAFVTGGQTLGNAIRVLMESVMTILNFLVEHRGIIIGPTQFGLRLLFNIVRLLWRVLILIFRYIIIPAIGAGGALGAIALDVTITSLPTIYNTIAALTNSSSRAPEAPPILRQRTAAWVRTAMEAQQFVGNLDETLNLDGLMSGDVFRSGLMGGKNRKTKRKTNRKTKQRSRKIHKLKSKKSTTKKNNKQKKSRRSRKNK